eukprot:NODE_20576_length_791_cov_6.403614.p2 GENE.NODE_20576_length_791_cov_6.403614~~NODE_20576_length_791_cov_6.403614.p2  ORF type:complete len:89 (-),score=23.15 NODE_20576_length_791_cov_6.403614:262-528(-)
MAGTLAVPAADPVFVSAPHSWTVLPPPLPDVVMAHADHGYVELPEIGVLPPPVPDVVMAHADHGYVELPEIGGFLRNASATAARLFSS